MGQSESKQKPELTEVRLRTKLQLLKEIIVRKRDQKLALMESKEKLLS